MAWKLPDRRLGPARTGRPTSYPITNLSVVRWAALLFLVADSTDIVVGVLAPSSVVGRPSGLDVVQTVLGLAACACLLWWRWHGAALTTAALTAMMLVRHPVGIEISVLVVGAAALAVALRPRAVPASLAGSVAYAGALGYSLHRENGTSWLGAVLVLVLVAVVVTAAGVIAGRLLREREDAHRALRELQAENRRIRTAERRALAAELQGILTRDFSSLRSTVQEVSPAGEPAELRRVIADLGDRSRSTLASVRVALRAMRADLDPGAAPADDPPAWIDALQSHRCRQVVGVACLVLAGLAVALATSSAVTTGIAGVPVAATAVAIASPLSVALALWRFREGLALGIVVLALGIAASQPSLWVALPTALLCWAAARTGRWHWIGIVVAAQLGYMAVHLTRHGTEAGTLVGLLEVVAISSILLGLTWSHFGTVRSSTRAELEQLHTQQGRIAAEERAGVARELHDVVGHQLSLVCLHSLAAEREPDPLVLGDLVRRIRQALEAGEAEVGELVGALHAAPDDPPSSGSGLSPTAVATVLAGQLHGHAYRARFAIDPRVDALDPTTRSTVARILQESGTNVLRHAPAGADCTFATTIEDDTLTFVARSPLPAPIPEPSLTGGFGLRGIRERVDLTGGTFFAGSRDGSWEVRVSIQAPSVVVEVADLSPVRARRRSAPSPRPA